MVLVQRLAKPTTSSRTIPTMPSPQSCKLMLSAAAQQTTPSTLSPITTATAVETFTQAMDSHMRDLSA